MGRRADLLVFGFVSLLVGGGLFGIGLRRGVKETLHPARMTAAVAPGGRTRRAHRLFNGTEKPMFFNRTQHLLKVRERLKTREGLSDKEREKMEFQVLMRRGRRTRRPGGAPTNLRGANDDE